MPLHHAVLALLAVKPAHGYELKGSFEQAVGDQWGGLNIGHLYQILDRPGPRRPDRLRAPAAAGQAGPAGPPDHRGWPRPNSIAGWTSQPSAPAATATISSSR